MLRRSLKAHGARAELLQWLAALGWIDQLKGESREQSVQYVDQFRGTDADRKLVFFYAVDQCTEMGVRNGCQAFGSSIFTNRNIEGLTLIMEYGRPDPHYDLLLLTMFAKTDGRSSLASSTRPSAVSYI